MNDEIQRQEIMINEALESYPQDALPPGFMNRIMGQVETLAQVQARPRVQPEPFRLHFIDIALALFIGGVVTLLLVTIFGYFGIVNLNWLPLDSLLSLNFIGNLSTDNLSATARFWLILGIVLFAEIGLGAGVCVQLWQDRPYAIT